jgi:hypothetical protein
MADIDKSLPNDVRTQLELPSEEEIANASEQVVEQEQTEKGPVEIQQNEDGSVDIDFDPSSVSPEGGDEHYANLAEFLPDNVLGPLGSKLISTVSRLQNFKKRLGKNLQRRFRFIRI